MEGAACWLHAIRARPTVAGGSGGEISRRPAQYQSAAAADLARRRIKIPQRGFIRTQALPPDLRPAGLPVGEMGC